MKRTLISIMLIVAMLALSGCGTAIPDVKGLDPAQAERTLKSAGFAVGKVTYDEKAAGVAGAVVAQEPAAGKSAKSGTMVVLTVAGPPPVPAPNVFGLDRAKAEAAVVAAGLAVGTVTESYNSTAPAGMVTSQTPQAKAEVAPGSSIILVVSKGIEPVGVPSVKGKTEATAKTTLQSVGFVVKVTKKANKAKKGVVIAQSPSGGMAAPGSAVSITVSTGVEMVRVPNVISAVTNHNYDSSYDEDPSAILAEIRSVAYATISGTGLKIDFSFAPVTQPDTQSPRAGSMVPKGTVVRVVIGVGD